MHLPLWDGEIYICEYEFPFAEVTEQGNRYTNDKDENRRPVSQRHHHAGQTKMCDRKNSLLRARKIQETKGADFITQDN